jgi:shikimate dehydrogenase
MREAAVIGTPVSHSLSPAIFSFLAQWLSVSEFQYAAREVQPAELKTFLNELRQSSGFVGLNVTIPHKETIVAELDEVTPEARAVGAVNVVQVLDARLLGHNTDIIGVTKTLGEHHCRIEGESAWVWGAGGAARAVCYALGQEGARIVHIASRNAERGQKLADGIGSIFPRTAFVAIPADSRTIDGPLSLVVNATPIGMKSAAKSGNAEELFRQLPKLDRRPGALAFDLVYNPERTPFLSIAEGAGLRLAGGLDMLIYQALATWEIWFGPAQGLADAKDELAEHLRAILQAR